MKILGTIPSTSNVIAKTGEEDSDYQTSIDNQNKFLIGQAKMFSSLKEDDCTPQDEV